MLIKLFKGYTPPQRNYFGWSHYFILDFRSVHRNKLLDLDISIPHDNAPVNKNDFRELLEKYNKFNLENFNKLPRMVTIGKILDSMDSSASDLTPDEFKLQKNLKDGVYRTSDNKHFQVIDKTITELALKPQSQGMLDYKNNQIIEDDEYISLFDGYTNHFNNIDQKEIYYLRHARFITGILVSNEPDTIFSNMGVNRWGEMKTSKHLRILIRNLLSEDYRISVYGNIEFSGNEKNKIYEIAKSIVHKLLDLFILNINAAPLKNVIFYSEDGPRYVADLCLYYCIYLPATYLYERGLNKSAPYLISDLKADEFKLQKYLKNGVYRTSDNEHFQVFHKKIIKLTLKDAPKDIDISNFNHNQEIRDTTYVELFEGYVQKDRKQNLAQPTESREMINNRYFLNKIKELFDDKVIVDSVDHLLGTLPPE